ncbi:MAG: hypothetical protein ACREAA_15350 [Candidatus Polarisedimenticolia bacterium]
MKRTRMIAWALALAVSLPAGGRSHGTEPAELSRLFPMEAEVVAGGSPLSRLLLPPEILSACRPDLSDLRLFDPQGREVAFLVDAGMAPEEHADFLQRFEPRLEEATRAETHRETGPPLRREGFDVPMPGEAPRSGTWVLVLEPRASEFVARVDVEGLGAAGAPVSLVKGGSLFRLRGARPAEKIRFPLPPFDGPRLRIVLETEHPFWLEPSVRLESAQVLERGGRIAVPLQILSVRAEEHRTLVDLSRPPGIVPDILRVETTTGTFDRGIKVWDEVQAGADASLGSGRVYRVAALTPVGENEIGLWPARGERLRVEIDNGDSPPLDQPTFSAVIRQPSLVFAGPGGILRFGGGRAHPPRYDVEGLLPPPAQVVAGKRADAAALLYEPDTVRPARLGATRPNPAYDRAPALAFAMHAGATVDPGMFRHVRSLTVPGSPEGLSKLRIEPADLAILEHDLSDMRVADETSHQWPYLLARDAVTDVVPLGVDGPTPHERASRYALRPPESPLGLHRLTLDAGSGYFDRAVLLTARLEDGSTTTLLRGRLTRPVGDTGPVSLELTPVRVTSLVLEVEDGDDAPLDIRSVQARVSLPELYLTAPAGRYELLMGAPGQDPPRYELERVRDVVLAVRAASITAGALETNQRYSLGSRLKGSSLWQTVLLWATLVTAVCVLAFLTLRLARGERPDGH